MLTFTILACFAALAHAGTSGYYYGPGLSGSLPIQGLPSAPAVQIGNKFNLPLPQVQQQFAQQVTHQVQRIPKKTLNVMFIMAPQLAAGKNIQVKVNSPETETETVIYLLSKQNDASEILEKIQELQQSIQVRPEVMIIKYRTEDELESAVKAVQDKYNDIGGPSPLIDGGVAPVIDYPSVGNQLSRH